MKIFVLCLLIISTIYAEDAKIASSIFNNVVQALTQQTKSYIFIHTQVESLEKYPGNLLRTYKCSEADIVIISNITNIPNECKEKIMFGTRYYHLKNKDVVGAFFWQKGRPNILFYKERLDKHKIRLSAEFDKYIAD